MKVVKIEYERRYNLSATKYEHEVLKVCAEVSSEEEDLNVVETFELLREQLYLGSCKAKIDKGK